MLPKMSAQRRGAFLKALEASGNQTLAAEKACVSRSWVCKERALNPKFDAEVRAAVRKAQDKLADHPEPRPPTGWGHLDGAQLVVRGTNGRRLQIARARPGQISPRTEQRLLQVLSATCNGDAACREAGVSKSAVWSHRKRWPAFARKWDETVRWAWGRLSAGLLENAENLFSPSDYPPELPLPPMTVGQVIQILHMHKHVAHGIGKAPGVRWTPPKTLAEVTPSILRKFESVLWARELREEEKARDRKEWARRRGEG